MIDLLGASTDDELVSLYTKRFVNRTDLWYFGWLTSDGSVVYLPMSQVKRYDYNKWRPYEPVSDSLIARHFSGEILLSWPAVDENGLAKWCCWDSDIDDGGLAAIASLLRAWSFKPLHESSPTPNKDGHLWLLFDEPLSGSDLIRFTQEVYDHAGIDPTGKIECFPKAKKFSPHECYGQVRAPLGVHLKPEAQGGRGWFVDAQPDLRSQLAWLQEQPLNSSARVRNIVAALRVADRKSHPSRSKEFSRKALTMSESFLELVPSEERRRKGSEWVAACPMCVREGHDRHGDNLRISLDGKKLNCVWGTPGNSPHRGAELIRALKSA